MPKKRLPAIADRAVWEKVTKGRAGIRWDSSRESTKGYRRKPRRDTVHREVYGVQERNERKDRNMERPSTKKQRERGGTLRDLREVKRRNRNENVFARPNGLRETAETSISCRGPGPARKKKEVPVIGRRRE